MKKLITICAVVTMILAVSGPAQANVTINWATGGVFVDNLASDYTQAGDFDTVTLNPASGALSLALNTPVDVLVNPLVYNVGYSSSSVIMASYKVLTEDITVNGNTQSLSYPVVGSSNYVGQGDTLLVDQGSPVTFGNIIVTPLGWDTPLINLWGPSSPVPVYAQFEWVPTTNDGGTNTIPVPGAILLGSLGVGLVGWLRRRRML